MQTTTKRGIYVKFDGQEIARKDLIRRLFTGDITAANCRPGSRSDIVAFLKREFDQDILFQQVYQATSDLQSSANARGRRTTVITLPNGSEAVRRDFIKEVFENGSSEYDLPSNDRGAIVKFLRDRCNHDVSFQIVYQATS